VGNYLGNYEAQENKIKFCRQLCLLPIQIKKMSAFKKVPVRFYMGYQKAILLTPSHFVLYSLSFLVIRTPVLFLCLFDLGLFWSYELQYIWGLVLMYY